VGFIVRIMQKFNPRHFNDVPKVKYLNSYDNQNVQSISYLTLVKKLNISGSTIKQDGISHLTTLTELYANNNSYITNVYFPHLKILHLAGNSSITDNELYQLKDINLTELNCSMNPNITKINFLRSLTRLIIPHGSAISTLELNKCEQLTYIYLIKKYYSFMSLLWAALFCGDCH
jgi:hypothetical protein